MLERILEHADPKTRAEIGRVLSQLADKLLARADQQDELEAELAHRRELNARYRALAPLVSRLMVWGKSLDEAAERVATRFRLDPVRLAAWWRGVSGAAGVRARRNRHIARMVSSGWCDAQIAELFGLSRKHVNRLASRMVRSGSWRRGHGGNHG